MYEEVQKKLQELLRLTNKVLPVKAGKAVREVSTVHPGKPH